jgi:hypothetical protein
LGGCPIVNLDGAAKENLCSFGKSHTVDIQPVVQDVSKGLYNGILDVAVWRVLRKRLSLKAFKLSIIQDVKR